MNTDKALLDGFGVAAELLIGDMPDLDKHLTEILRQTEHAHIYWAALGQALDRKIAPALIAILGRLGADAPPKPNQPANVTVRATYCMVLLADELAVRTGTSQKATRMLIGDFERLFLS